MRLVALAVGALVIAMPASAAGVDPRALVLRQDALPAGYLADRHESQVTTNESYTSPPGLSKVVVKSGRVTGYRCAFRHRTSKTKAVNAGVDLFRSRNAPVRSSPGRTRTNES